MSKGENIFKRKDGRWEARYIKGYELSGKIKYGFCYGKTYREAKEKVTKCKAALVNGKPIPSTNSRHRFSFYCDEWLRMRKPKVKESTYIKYDTALRKHIKPKLGGCFPMGMTTGLIDEFTEELLFEDELAPKTVHDVLVVLHGKLMTEQEYMTLKHRYKAEAEEAERLIEALTCQQAAEAAHTPENPFLTAFGSFRNADTLTREMAQALIQRVYVDGGSNIEIVFRYRDEYKELCTYLEGRQADA